MQFTRIFIYTILLGFGDCFNGNSVIHTTSLSQRNNKPWPALSSVGLLGLQGLGGRGRLCAASQSLQKGSLCCEFLTTAENVSQWLS